MACKAVAFAFLLALFNRGAIAHPGVSDRDPVLSKDIYTESSKTHVDWRLATLVTQEQYDQAKQGASANFVIYGVPVGGNYDEFKANIAKFYSSHNESLSIDQSRQIAFQYLSTNSLAAYKACLLALDNKGYGLFLDVVGLDHDTARLSLYYKGGANDPNFVRLEWQGDTKFLPSSIVKATIRHETTVEFIVKRPQSGSITLAVNVAKAAGVNGDSLAVPSYIPPPLPLWTLKMWGADDSLKCNVNGKLAGSRSYGQAIEEIPLAGFLKQGNNTLQCYAEDKAKQDGHWCWEYQYVLLRDGYYYLGGWDRQCNASTQKPGPLPSFDFYNGRPANTPFGLVSNAFRTNLNVSTLTRQWPSNALFQPK